MGDIGIWDDFLRLCCGCRCCYPSAPDEDRIRNKEEKKLLKDYRRAYTVLCRVRPHMIEHYDPSSGHNDGNELHRNMMRVMREILDITKQVVAESSGSAKPEVLSKEIQVDTVAAIEQHVITVEPQALCKLPAHECIHTDYDDLKANLETKSKVISDLNIKLVEKDEEKKTLIKDLISGNEKLDQLQKRLRACDGDKVSLKARIEYLEANIFQLTCQNEEVLTKSNSDAGHLNMELCKADMETQRLQKEIGHLEESVRAKDGKIQSMEVEMREIKAALEKTRDEKRTLEMEMMKMGTELKIKISELDDVKSKLRTKSDQLHEKEKVMAETKQELDALEREKRAQDIKLARFEADEIISQSKVQAKEQTQSVPSSCPMLSVNVEVFRTGSTEGEIYCLKVPCDKPPTMSSLSKALLTPLKIRDEHGIAISSWSDLQNAGYTFLWEGDVPDMDPMKMDDAMLLNVFGEWLQESSVQLKLLQL